MSYFNRYKNAEDLLGKTMASVVNLGDEIIFTTDNGEVYKMYHEQDCCESVDLDDVSGDLQDLVGSPLTMAEEVCSPALEDEPKYEYEESWTWTFYKFATIKGYVNLKWYGSSNGYYSEGVSIILQK